MNSGKDVDQAMTGSFFIKFRPCCRDESIPTGDNHIILAGGTVNDEQRSILVPAAHDADMLILRVKYQVSRHGLVPGYSVAIGVLHHGPSYVADDILPAAHIVEHPIHKPGAI